mmetsp:Transcript_33800/g.95663  ORF Transcript_33800/g.95663 Transcript_33800/m.95663 type:complete len:201 (+) Transcript_33800:2249-2851(+)
MEGCFLFQGCCSCRCRRRRLLLLGNSCCGRGGCGGSLHRRGRQFRLCLTNGSCEWSVLGCGSRKLLDSDSRRSCGLGRTLLCSIGAGILAMLVHIHRRGGATHPGLSLFAKLTLFVSPLVLQGLSSYIYSTGPRGVFAFLSCRSPTSSDCLVYSSRTCYLQGQWRRDELETAWKFQESAGIRAAGGGFDSSGHERPTSNR